MDANYSFGLGQNDGWVMVNAKDGSRSPQYNGDNEPSGHKANASTSPSRHNSFSFEEIETFGQDLPPAYSQKAISNCTSETMTSGTATFTEDQIAAPHAQYGPTGESSRAKETLTQSNLHRHEHLAAVNVSGWVVNSGTGSRLIPYPAAPSNHGSMSVGRSVPSTTGSVAHERTSGSPTSVGDEFIVAAGAWTDDPIGILINSTSNLGLDSE